MDTKIIDMATDKKFTEFSDAINTTLMSKLSSNQHIKDYTVEYDNIQFMKAKYKEINDIKAPEEGTGENGNTND